MPPKRKRKASVEEETTKRGKRDVARKSQSVLDELNKPFSVKRCKSWFQHYAGKDEPDVVGPEGIEKLCKDLAVEPENIVMLVLAWKLEAETMGFFKFEEWCKGMGLIECDSTAKLHAKLSSLRLLIHDFSTFKKIYRYAFDFCRNKDQRNLDIETAKAMLKLLLENSWTLLDSFLEFLEQSKYKVINKDQWCNVLEFSRSIKPDLSNYDEDGAWPVMLDEFVEWCKAQVKGQNR